MRIRTGINTDRNGTAGAGPDSKRTVRRDPAGKCQNSQPSRRVAGRRKDKDGKAGDDGLEFMQEMADGLGTRLAISLPAGLMLPFSGAPNAVYGLPDMCRLLLSVCSCRTGSPAPRRSTIWGRTLKSSKRLPSRRRMPGIIIIIKGVRRDHTLSRCSRMATRSMLQARRRGMLRPR